MYSSEYADKDPRNPMNWEGREVFTVERRSHVMGVANVLDHYDSEDKAKNAILNCEDWQASELFVRDEDGHVVFSAEWDEGLQCYVEAE